MLVRLGRFGTDHATSFPRETVAARAFAEVQAAVDALDQHALAQASARARDKIDQKDLARSVLRDALRAIGRTARALPTDDARALASKFRVPKSSGDHALLTAARAMARAAEDITPAFVDHGLPPSFVAELDGHILALEQASSEYDAVKNAGVAATAGVDAVLARAITSVHRLDVIVANVFRDDAPALAVWRTARRVGQGRRPAGPESTAEVTPIRLLTNAA